MAEMTPQDREAGEHEQIATEQGLSERDLDAMERVARAATAGPWRNGIEDLEGVVAPDAPGLGNVICCPPTKKMYASAEHWPENGAYIATFDPPTVLRLIAAARRRPRLLAALKEALAFYDRAELPHMPGEAKILDEMSAAIVDAEVSPMNKPGDLVEREQIALERPTAYLVHWWDESSCLRCRVQLSDVVEPWLHKLGPAFTPLYPAEALRRSTPADTARANPPKPRLYRPDRPDEKIQEAFVFEGGALTVKTQGYGAQIGSGWLSFRQDELQPEYGEDGKDYWIANLDASDMIALRDKLNELWPPADTARAGEGFTPVTGLWRDQSLSRLERVRAHRMEFNSELRAAVDAVEEEAARQELLSKAALSAAPTPTQGGEPSAPTPSEREKVLEEALKRSAEGWANAIELNIIAPQHIASATILRDEARAALSTPSEEGKA